MIFVFDLDGTICFKGQPLSDKIVYALEQLHHKGHTVIFASARPIRDMLPVLHENLHTYTLIGGNGSMISHNGKLQHATYFSSEQRQSITTLLAKYNATYLIDGEWDYAYTGASDHPILRNVDPNRLAQRIEFHELSNILKVLVLSAEHMEQLAEELEKLQVVIHRHRSEHVLDISPSRVDKWQALTMLNIQEKSYIAFGNDANDITMFAHAKHSVMIGHHDELAKYAAEAISLNEDTEVEIINKLLLLS